MAVVIVMALLTPLPSRFRIDLCLAPSHATPVDRDTVIREMPCERRAGFEAREFFGSNHDEGRAPRFGANWDDFLRADTAEL